MPEIFDGPRPADVRDTSTRRMPPSERMPTREDSGSAGFEAAAEKLGAVLVGKGADRHVKKRHFQSILKGLRITIEAIGPKLNPVSGEYVAGEHKYVQFRDGHLWTDDKKVILAIEANQDYGLTIFDADQWARVIKARKVESAKEQILMDDELRGELLADSEFRDFIVAAAQGEKPKLPESMLAKHPEE